MNNEPVETLEEAELWDRRVHQAKRRGMSHEYATQFAWAKQEQDRSKA